MAAGSAIKRSIVFFLVPDFTLIAFATAIEPLRSANRMLGYDAYQWRLASVDGKPVRASNGVECAVTTSLDDERRKMTGPERPSMVIVCSGINIEGYRNKTAFAWLREEYNRGVKVGVFLAKHMRLDDQRLVIGAAEIFIMRFKATVFRMTRNAGGRLHGVALVIAGRAFFMHARISLCGDFKGAVYLTRWMGVKRVERRGGHERRPFSRSSPQRFASGVSMPNRSSARPTV